ncbi:MAG: DNA repair protein RecO [Deltaproteobacteria bacterium CG_4_8_14_3_um_filter_45_9]|jgi:DNA repair protein RecO (recombination protein O)|nr:MAG: DNA repair protein RecO [Deltaproteobacteria bacterium CG03_land_8_20_14_0_80_45_14]PIX26013.1 MAG: DNA repair protein RecO [Deltaproteobacteria bacterium CG_4_8_14_3_um_filter_45_9]
MPLFTTNAIVIRSLNYGESDKILTFFSKDFGKLKGIAKGARRSRKRFQNALGLFSHLRLIFFDKEGMGLVRAESCDILHSFPKIKEDLKKILYGSYYLELVNEMAGEREANSEAFGLLLSFLSNLEEMDPQEEQLRLFEIRMLSLFGYRPNMGKCGLCKKGWEDLQEIPTVFFSLEKGALVCERCSKMWNNLIPLSLGTARLIEKISQMELSKIQRLRFTLQALSESRELLPKFISYQLGKELKSLKTLGDIGANLSSPFPLSHGGLRLGRASGSERRGRG